MIRSPRAERGQITSTGVAIVAVILLAVVLGLGAGYFLFRPDPPPALAATAASAAGQAAHAAGEVHGHNHPPGMTCNYELPAEDAHVLAGLICDCEEPHCNKTPLPDCHCDQAHAMKSATKKMLAQGRSRDEIITELEKMWGVHLRPQG